MARNNYSLISIHNTPTKEQIAREVEEKAKELAEIKYKELRELEHSRYLFHQLELAGGPTISKLNRIFIFFGFIVFKCHFKRFSNKDYNKMRGRDILED